MYIILQGRVLTSKVEKSEERNRMEITGELAGGWRLRSESYAEEGCTAILIGRIIIKSQKL
jgi:hypothetical protein